MHTIKAQRIIGALLAMSGAFYAVVAIGFAPLWLGSVVWVGWVAIAFGGKRWQERWFWLVSFVWNMAIAALLIGSGLKSSIGSLYALAHSIAAVVLSAYLSVVVPWNTWPENRKA